MIAKMISKEEFLAILDEELGFAISAEDLKADVGNLAGWDSVMLLRVLLVFEKKLNRRISLPRLLEARTMAAVFEVMEKHG
jgi:acyl carrier protein